MRVKKAEKTIKPGKEGNGSAARVLAVFLLFSIEKKDLFSFCRIMM